VEEAEDVEERSAEFRRQHATLDAILAVARLGDDECLEDVEALPREPDDVLVELEGLGVAARVQLPQLAGAVELSGEEDRQAEDLVEGAGEEGIIRADCGCESTEKLLVDV